MEGAPLSAEDRERFIELTKSLQEEALRGAQDPRAQEQAATIARRADSIANPELAKERERILRFLGIDPESEHALYIFVSWSMPVDMLRAYAVEAMWTGGTLVFRGIPPGRELQEFLLNDMRQLIWGEGASTAINLDPRMYDTYQVTRVPTFVLSRSRDNFICTGAGTRQVRAGKQTVSYDLCPPLDRSKYVKLSGAVTLDYALETFERDNWKEASVYLRSLRRAYAPGQEAGQAQRGFTGEWNDAFTPDKAMKKRSPER